MSAMNWQPIETAPKDGTEVLLGGCKYGPPVRMGSWGGGRYNRTTRSYEGDWRGGGDYGFAPTHWMPLPAPPTEPPSPPSPLSEMTAAELDREYKAYDALNLAKNKLIRQAEELAEYGPLERYRPLLHAFANLAEAAWDNTMGSQFRPLFDALQAAEKREEEAAREAERRGAAA